jgi:hypothetical protein
LPASPGTRIVAHLCDNVYSDPQVRVAAWALAEQFTLARKLRRDRCAPAHLVPHSPTNLADVDDADLIDRVLWRTARSDQSCRWFEILDLTANLHLAPHQAEFVAMCMFASNMYGQCRTVVDRVATLIERYGLHECVNETGDAAALRNARDKLDKAAAAVAAVDERPDAWRVGGPARAKRLVNKSYRPKGNQRVQPASQWSDPWASDASDAALFLAARLGENEGAWQLLWEIVDTFDGTTAELARVVTATVR